MIHRQKPETARIQKSRCQSNFPQPRSALKEILIPLPSVRRRLSECLRMDLPLLCDEDIRGFHYEVTDHPLLQNYKQSLQGLKHRFYTVLFHFPKGAS
jgi:hypothetical protein